MCGCAGGRHLPSRRRDDAKRRRNDGNRAQEGLVAADMGAWASDDPEHGSASVTARPGRTGECAAEAGGRAAAEEGEMAEAEPDRLHCPAIRGLVSRVTTQVVLCM